MLEEELNETPETEESELNQEDLFEDDNEFLEEDDSVNEETDSSEEESEEDSAEVTRLMEELEKVRSRLHDTQQGFHSVCQERAKMRKRIEELEAKEADEDEWFSSSDDEELERVREEYAKSEQAEKEALAKANSVEEEQNAKRYELWESKAKSVRNSHEDYDEVVTWLNQEVGRNPRVKEEWQTKPQTPQEAYALGKKWISFIEGKQTPVRKVSNRSALDSINSSTISSGIKSSGARLEDFF